MSADQRRRAAALMRDRADRVGDRKSYPGRWDVEQCDPDTYGDGAYVTCLDGRGDVTKPEDPEVAEHVASWDPDVARAVADLLEELAEDDRLGIGTPTSTIDAADAVARAYLREPPPAVYDGDPWAPPEEGAA